MIAQRKKEFYMANKIYILFLLIACTLGAQDSAVVDSEQTINVPADSLSYDELFPDFDSANLNSGAFSVGEYLEFKIRYGFIVAGQATMSVKDSIILNGRPVYHIQTTANSVSTFDWIYKVRDEVNSFMDVQGLFSWKFSKKLREGSYKADLNVEYNPYDLFAYVTAIRYKDDKSVKNYKVKIPPGVRDILAAFYYVRNLDLKVGQSQYLTNHDNKKVYNLEVKVHKEETIDVEAGKFKCLLIEPLLQGEGIFKQKGRLLVWMTNDKYKIPVQMTSEVVVGHITTELMKIKAPGYKITSRIK